MWILMQIHVCQAQNLPTTFCSELTHPHVACHFMGSMLIHGPQITWDVGLQHVPMCLNLVHKINL